MAGLAGSVAVERSAGRSLHRQLLNRRIEVEQHRLVLLITDYALDPQARSNTLVACHRLDLVQTRGGKEYEIAAVKWLRHARVGGRARAERRAGVGLLHADFVAVSASRSRWPYFNEASWGDKRIFRDRSAEKPSPGTP